MENNNTKAPFKLKEANSIWRKVLHLGTKQEIPKGYNWIIKDDDASFSFLDKGCVRLECFSNEGKQRILQYMESGCIFREVSAARRVNASLYGRSFFVATEDCVLYNFPDSLFHDLEFIKEYPELMANLLYTTKLKAASFFTLLAGSNEEMLERVLCRYFNELAVNHNSNTFAPQISQADLALILGIHRSTLCRAIKQLREDGIIGNFTRFKLEILDKEKLQKLAER